MTYEYVNIRNNLTIFALQTERNVNGIFNNKLPSRKVIQIFKS